MTDSTETQLELFEEYKADSGILKSVYSSMGSNGGQGSFYNPVTGVGSARDPSQYLQITSPHLLSHSERIGLLEGSRICQNIVQVYPMEASWGQFNFTAKNESQGANNWIQDRFENFRLGSLQSSFVEASIEARLHGESYLLLGVDDGQAFDQPLDFNNIQAFSWVKLFVYNQVELLEGYKDTYQITLGSLDNQPGYEILPGKLETKIRVHKSRLLKFIGDYLPPSILMKRKKHQSSLQCAFDGFSLAMQSLLNSNAMLGDHSLFWYKLDGLASLVRAKKFDEIYSRFLTLQMSKSVLKGLAMDAKSEDAGFINRSYGGVKDILETMIDYMVAETGMVRFKVLGTANRSGLGAEGRGIQDRLEHSLKVKSWQNFTWKDHLIYCTKLLLLAKDSLTSGKIPSDLGLSFPPVLELDPLEISKLIDANITWAIKAIDAGLLSPLEARLGILGSSENMLSPVISLDHRFTQLLESDQESQSEPDQEIEYIDPTINPPTAKESSNTLESLNIDPDSIDNGVFDRADGTGFYLVYVAGRHTAIVVEATNRVEAIRKARAKKAVGAKNIVIEARQATEKEARDIRSGRWVRTEAKSYKNTDPFKYRPQFRPKKDSLTTWVKCNLDSIETLLEISLDSEHNLIEFDQKSGKWLLYDPTKTRVIGRFRTEEDAKRREKQTNFFRALKSDPDLQKKVDELRSDDEPMIVEATLSNEDRKKVRSKMAEIASIDDSSLTTFLSSL